MRSVFFIFLCLVWSDSLLAQNSDNGVELTAGIELRALVPISFFTMEDVTLQDSAQSFQSTYSYQGGYGFGGVVRVRFTKLLNFETGIYYTRRVYKYDILDPATGFNESVDLRIIGYEIPVKGLIYIQMAEQIYMNVAIGVSADFFASDVEHRKPEFVVRAFKESWIKIGALANIGAEYRTKKDGYFYLGASFHQPFGDITFTQVDYFPVSQNVPIPSNLGQMDGAYFSIDFRYFFAPEKAKKSKVRYVKPDWKNM